MKYVFNKNKIKVKFRPYIVINTAVCIILAIANRLYNTLGSSSKLTIPLILIFLFFAICLCLLFFVRYVEYRTYKNSFISIHKGKIKFRRNNMQNFWGEYSEYPEYNQYKIEPTGIEVSDKKIVLYGEIEFSLIDENDYTEKTEIISKVKIPAYYDDWQKLVEKITSIVIK